MSFKVLVNLVFVLVLSVRFLFAGAGTTAYNFLKLPQGLRATSMGNSYVALAEGPEAIYWNPAGLAQGAFNEVRTVFNDWFDDVYYGFGAYRHDFKSSGICLAVTYLNSGSITKRSNGKESLGTYKMSDIGIDIGYGFKITDEINTGFSLKYVSETIDSESSVNLLGGAGFQFGKRINEHYVNVGASIMNIGAASGYDEKYPMPTILRFGVSDELLNSRVLATTELDYYFNEKSFSGGIGIEYTVATFLDIRAGYKIGYSDIDLPYGLTLGVGFKYTENLEYLFDYSVSALGELGIVNRIGFGVRL